ncbi:alpha amylase, catalytic region [Paraglaciecola sp. T6c]|uniref:alpha-amylase family glycosyl hydrolase n=1 Tax=Pseudoalteromonas atlantica (strain T6c / ATCC BAA-1087) TaxID=3042615 RepID=UPI00005C750F|nr:alpha-amylase family glycosyl hydrolase [Paraglaciecola sp. T6c]ABG39901.1 alpha amylase, catalytic region [Paraglaciecola sp. T6c]
MILSRALSLIFFAVVITGCGTAENQDKQHTVKSESKVAGIDTANNKLPNANYLLRDVRDDVFYFVMPDRFNNGDSSNDNGAVEGGISAGGFDATSNRGFHGGDMQGIEQKLDYLQGMGITAIWMTPILRNKAVQRDGVAHHGYWIVDFTEIDPHFGSNDDLKSLIATAHEKGIKVFFDIITNHTADVVKYEECHHANGDFKAENHCLYKSLQQLAEGDDYTPFVPLREQTVKVPAWLNDPQFYHNQGDTTFTGESSLNGDFSGLDDLDTENPKVLQGMIEIYKDLIKEFKPDGFRIDTVRHVRMPFWQTFSPSIMAYAQEQGIPNFHIFGEVYDPDPAQLSRFTTQGKLPSVLDFGFQQAAADVFYRKRNPQTIDALFAQDDLYTDEDSQADLLMTFLGNHDMGRTGYFIEQGVPDASNEEKLQRSILSHAFMYLSRGIPVVYYADEQGFTGDGNDVNARQDMFPSLVASDNDDPLLGSSASTADNNFDPLHPIYLALGDLAQLRHQHEALRRGQYESRYFNEDSMMFAFARKLPQGKEYLAVFNAGTEAASLTLPAQSTHYEGLVEATKFNLSDGVIKVTVPALSFALYQAK